ncbi:MAG TPA: hypothetical protein PLX60_08570 [Chitinophagales bacterium]|nr:hypothetical protein [Chitinophagales bacterium]
MYNTPLLLVVYNRPEYTSKLFDAIKVIKPRFLYIAGDGPKDEKDRILVEQTRAVFNQIDWDCELKLYYRTHNEGCGLGVSNGISWFFDQVEYGVILEDDCIPTMSFFYYCEELLVKYKDNPDVMMIGGSSWLDASFTYPYDYFFTHIGSIWGWASYKRAWKKYQFSITPEMIALAKANKVWSEFSDKETKKFRLKLLQATFDKTVDTWDIQWAYCLSVHKGISILPIKNQITNIGVNGVNYNSETRLTNLNTFNIDVKAIRHPTQVVVDEKMDKYYQELESKKFLRRIEPAYRYYYNKSKYYILRFLISIGLFNENPSH